MAKCFNPTCSCKNLKIVREIILRCANCHCAVKVESTKLDSDRHNLAEAYTESIDWNSKDCERLLFTVTKNAE